jgi:CheY-like chemotaxis protein
MIEEQTFVFHAVFGGKPARLFDTVSSQHKPVTDFACSRPLAVRGSSHPAVYKGEFQRKAGPVAVSFFGGPDGVGARVWSAGKFVSELEALCTDVLVAGVDLGLPQHLLNQLWAAVGHGEMPAAYQVDIPAAPGQPLQASDVSSSGAVTTAAAEIQHAAPTDLRPLVVKKTVAVVDDDPMMLDVLARILQRENFDLLLGGGGLEIMQKIERHHGTLDLLVTDYAMPGMQGRELADRVRRRFPAVKVLYQTGFSDQLFENRTELEEGEAFVEKPFTARGLREAVRMVLFGSINP